MAGQYFYSPSWIHQNYFRRKEILKDRTRRFYLPFVLLLVFGGFVFLLTQNSAMVEAHLKDWGIRIEGVEDFDIKDVSKKHISRYLVTTLWAQKNVQILKFKMIENINEKVADSYIKDRVTGINSLFLEKRASYPGIVTKQTLCPKEYHPEFFEIKNDKLTLSYYMTYAGKRFSYGVCAEDLIAYKALLGFAYCRESKKVFVLEIFVPPGQFGREHYKNIAESFSCT